MTLLRLLLAWLTGLLVALVIESQSGDVGLRGLAAGKPAGIAPTALRVEMDALGYLRVTVDGGGRGAALALEREAASGQLTLTDQRGEASLLQLPAGQNQFVLETSQGQLEIALPEEGERLDLALTYAGGEGGWVVRAEHNLAVTGAAWAGALILQAGNDLSLGPGAYNVGGDLRLLAGAALQMRDAEAEPLMTQIGGQFILEGRQGVDIFALNHPASALRSELDMVLRSAQPVRGDAHYLSGGEFRIEQMDGRAGHLISPQDPIILASQNVSLGSYVGASLHILAGGSITVTSVTITSSDTGANTINPSNATLFNGVDAIGSLASFNLSDATPVTINGETRPTLDVRAGINWSTFTGGAPSNQVIPAAVVTPTFSGPAAGANINIGSITLSPPNGMVLLTNQYRPNAASGNITAGTIDASTASPGGDGGVILIDSRDHITVSTLNTRANVAGSAAGNGGAVRALAEGNINQGSILTYAHSGAATAGNGGDVTISAGGTLVGAGIESSAESVTGSGDGGDIQITATGPVTLTAIQSHTRFEGAGFAGDAGDVSLLVQNAGALDGGDDLHANIIWSDSGAWYSGGAVGPSGDGADVSVVVEDGDIVFSDWIWVQTLARGGANAPGDGGSVAITATTGAISVGSFGFNTRSEAASGSSGDSGTAGDVRLTAAGNIEINTTLTSGGILADSRAITGTSHGGGAVWVESTGGDIDFGLNNISVLAFSSDGPAGDTGGITLLAAGDINARFLGTQSQSNGAGATGNAGPVLATAGGRIDLPSGIVSVSDSQAGAAGNGGDITITAGGPLSTTSIASYVESATGAGEAGDIQITATGPVTVTTIRSHARFTGAGFAGAAGDVSILVQNAGALDGADGLRATYIWSDSGAWYHGGAAGPSGDGADVSIVVEDGDVVFSEWVWVQTLARGGANAPGDGGTVAITATQGAITIGSFGINTRSEAASGSSGDSGLAGDVTLVAEGNIEINTALTNGGILADTWASSGMAQAGGTVWVESTGGDIDLGMNYLFAGAFSAGGATDDGGRITLTAAGGIRAGHVRSHTSAPGGAAGDAGPMALTAGGDIEVATLYAAALGGAGNGAGGAINVEAGQFVRVTAPVSDSIDNRGLPNMSTITVTHGGNGVTPFIVGDAATNGTAGAITSGDATLSPTQPYLYIKFEPPNIWILTDADFPYDLYLPLIMK